MLYFCHLTLSERFVVALGSVGVLARVSEVRCLSPVSTDRFAGACSVVGVPLFQLSIFASHSGMVFSCELSAVLL